MGMFGPGAFRRLCDQLRNGLGLTVSVPVTAEIWGTGGDSVIVGLIARDTSIDLAWPNTYNIRTRAPAGITQQLPYDQIVDPATTPVNYLSLVEYFQKQRQANTGLDNYLAPANINGTRLMSNGEWLPGNVHYNAAVARYNAAISTTKATVPGAAWAGFIFSLGTNDALLTAGTFTEAQAFAALSSLCSGMRSDVKVNGNAGGAGVGNVPIIFLQQIPENVANTNGSSSLPFVSALRRLAATVPNVKIVIPAEGSYRAGDTQHLSLAGERTVGAQMGTQLSDAVGPTITSSSGFSLYDGQKLLYVFSFDKYGYPVLSGADAAKFEVVPIQDHTDSNIVVSRYYYGLRFVGNVAKSFASPDDANLDGTYEVTATGISANGVAGTPKALSFPVIAAYGANTGAITYTPPTAMAFTGVPTGVDGRFCENVTLTGPALNIIYIRRNSGGDNITSIVIDGNTFTPIGGTMGEITMFAVPVASTRTTRITLQPAAGALNVGIHITAITGTVLAPTDVQTYPYNGGSVGPHSVTLNVPVGGIGLGFGYDSANPTALSGCTISKYGPNYYYSLRRTTDGSAATGVNVGSNSASFMGMASFAKAA